MEELENLVKIKQFKKEPADQNEFDGMVLAATTKLKDVSIQGLSLDSQFSIAYGAAHALALAALRWHGYRSENRYLVFQCLQHTVGLASSKWRIFDICHKKRNLAEYEGQLDVDKRLVAELITSTQELLLLVNSLQDIC
ncbi:hypothetical protein A9Q98_06360 [Thalassotalea sp. 42_200_T64]|nr:hypothetical protein A9Q98_06360 [Thalassotalea sp. 42_200_T64]